jgi:hypothetical protein
MKRLSFLLILGMSLLCFGCVSNNQNKEVVQENVIQIPKWITDQGRLELFPSNLYISQMAYGTTAQESKEKACANISEYIKSTVETTTTSSYFYKESSKGVTENREIKENILISTDNNLYKIEYTNPFYYSDLGNYVCVAFINREQAFYFVKPKLENAKRNFPVAYENSLAKDSLLDKIIGIKNAQATLKDFYEVYDFARAINSTKANVYEEIDFLAKESLITLKDLCSKVLVHIKSVGDVLLVASSGLIAELSNQFGKMGFVVANSNKSNCIVLVEVKRLITQTPNTFETYPELYVKIIEKGVEKISYSKKLSKVAGFDKETVIRRTNLALVNEIKTSFVEECF